MDLRNAAKALGSKGGKATAKSMSREDRKRRAQIAARKRWAGHTKKPKAKADED